ncbi:CRISPR-associated endoribonuclease Cas2 [bacterium HR35]|nr:CRISPR-associated endoribonuclease Cas2 [bacterium HR35]
MRYIISYDISENKIRNRLVRILEKYGERVQYSVFEFELDNDAFRNLLSELKVNGFLRRSKNYKLYIYCLKPHLVKKIKRVGNKPFLDSKFLVV